MKTKRFINSPIYIAFLATSIGGVVSLVWILLDITGAAELTMPQFVLVILVVYGWAGLAVSLAAAFRHAMTWLLLAGVLPLLFWNFFEILGAADITHLLPLAIYCWAIARAFTGRGRQLQEWRG